MQTSSIGDWELGIGDWGLGQSPIPNPQSPYQNFLKDNLLIFLICKQIKLILFLLIIYII